MSQYTFFTWSLQGKSSYDNFDKDDDDVIQEMGLDQEVDVQGEDKEDYDYDEYSRDTRVKQKWADFPYSQLHSYIDNAYDHIANL